MKRMFHAIFFIIKIRKFHYFFIGNKSKQGRSSWIGVTTEMNLKKDLLSIIWTLIGINAWPTHKFQNIDLYKYQFVYKINDIELNGQDTHLI